MEKIFDVSVIENCDDKNLDKNSVYIENSNINKIFNGKIKNLSDRRYVKITNKKTNKSIYRIARSGNSNSIKKDEILVNYDGKLKLFENYSENNSEFKIRKCSGTAYCFHHPDYFSRISFIWAFVASIVGFLSFAVSICSLVLAIKQM